MTGELRWYERRSVKAIVALVVMVAVVVACGGDDDDDVAATTVEPTTVEPTSTTTEPTTIDPTTIEPTSTTNEPQERRFDLYLLPATADDCSAVVAVPRTSTVEGVLGDALTQLLAGPTPEEAARGLRSWFSETTAGMLNGVTLENGRAEIDFDDFSQVIPNASSSCGSASLLAQLDHTVLQFEGVDDAVYSFGGDRAAFYEWLQLSAPE